MVGGDKAIFDKYYDLMKAMGVPWCIPGKLVQVTLPNWRIGHCSAEYCRDVRSVNAGNQRGVNPDLVYQAIRGGLAGSTGWMPKRRW